MQTNQASRKRAAPGTSPMPPLAPQQQNLNFQQPTGNADFGSYDFSQPFNAEQTFGDASIAIPQDANNFSYMQDAALQPAYGTAVAPVPVQSTDLVRRARNHPLAPQNGQDQDQWMSMGGNSRGATVSDEDEQDLDMKVALAKRDAQGKRKQIPPFVQKLSSFLDSSHTDLIRWSDDGRSFIVLDEDEFARTLIPELFKHNNYASFVRQLNMYGFHKTVNITDGSLRQSEKARKGVKPPSMYSHPYFRKNRPDLLWLIQKPTTKPGVKRKRDGTVKDQFDSDDERQYSPPVGGNPISGVIGEVSGSGASQDVATLPRNELVTVRRELQKLQNQQRYISQMISSLKEQNDQFYRQASAFQALHDRHENSINAILTFLATFYNRSLEGHGAQNLVNMFNNVAQSQQPQGSVEEVPEGATDSGNRMPRFFKKQPLLLPGPVTNLQSQSPQQPGIAVTAPPSARTSISPPHDGSKRDSTSSVPPQNAWKASTSTNPVIKDDAPTPNLLNTVPENDEMMSLINGINATNASTPSTAAPAFDFSSALEHYQNANGNAPLTPQQRDTMLALMANQQASTNTAGSNGNNALVSPTPPTMPDLNQLKETQQQLEMLTNLQKVQDEKVQELNRRLQPLSPTGSIPGIAKYGDEDPFNITGAPGDYDPNAFVNFDDEGWGDISAANSANPNFDFSAGNSGGEMGDGIDWDFGNNAAGDDMFQLNNDAVSQAQAHAAAGGSAPPMEDHHHGGSGHGRVESLSSEATSPAHTVAEQEEPGSTPRKRARRS
ncbi:Heat shock transcription factor [Recurvomyces mirabilis]|uniref:Heat shock transcription factor n=1 Tax=Recurvomyces mirabilis TaxID=574656 RepID=A0AAE1C387_9PEZI|nr:Heat shock transcription factor [Recurvomyces mirabilis]KAK5154855.1 Heat shock transcription factor [Recurvomyces mirabilis]